MDFSSFDLAAHLLLTHSLITLGLVMKYILLNRKKEFSPITTREEKLAFAAVLWLIAQVVLIIESVESSLQWRVLSFATAIVVTQLSTLWDSVLAGKSAEKKIDGEERGEAKEGGGEAAGEGAEEATGKESGAQGDGDSRGAARGSAGRGGGRRWRKVDP